jgi:hypothetical protein
MMMVMRNWGRKLKSLSVKNAAFPSMTANAYAPIVANLKAANVA